MGVRPVSSVTSVGEVHPRKAGMTAAGCGSDRSGPGAPRFSPRRRPSCGVAEAAPVPFTCSCSLAAELPQ
eukprot:scaffold9376_cov85-Isochrysis_galbana.AAC.4